VTVGLPSTFVELLVLAGVLTFLITSVGALITTMLISRNGVLYLGSQLALLFLAIYLSRQWSHALVFGAMFSSPEVLGRAAAAGCIVATAFAADMALKYWVWEGVALQEGRAAVPRLLVGVTRLMVYLVTVLTVLQFVYGQSITALATLSGAFALVLGLSAQSTLGEMFAGIAIALSKPFRIGDWVKIGDLEEGQVVDMTWRLVSIRNRSEYTLNVTNRLVADQPIRNFSYPSRVVRITDTVYFDSQLDPGVVQSVLDAALEDVPGILAVPAASALFGGMRERGAEYRLRYFIDDYAERDRISEGVWKAVVDATRRSGLVIVLPRQYVQLAAEPWQGGQTAT
jgi:branched-chain amino acid transport system substrate-binding protein